MIVVSPKIKRLVICCSMLGACSAALLSPPATAQEKGRPLKVGDLAPPLKTFRWLKGDSIGHFRGDQVYVIEFTASHCVPCRKVIPHLSAVAAKYRGMVTTISIYTGESDESDTTDLSYLDKIKTLLTGLGNQVKFGVAADAPHQSMKRNWMYRAGFYGYPVVFIVGKDGRIAWMGPASNFEPYLGRLLQGELDIARAYEEQQSLSQEIADVFQSAQAGNVHTAIHRVDNLIAMHPSNTKLLSVKFKLLAGADDVSANRWLEELLVRKPPHFVWDVVVGDILAMQQTIDFDLAHRVIQRALNESETDLSTANLLLQQARLWERYGNLTKARESLDKAVQFAEHSSDSAAMRRFELRSSLYRLKELVSLHDPGAADFLIYLMESDSGGMPWLAVADVMAGWSNGFSHGLFSAVLERTREYATEKTLGWVLFRQAQIWEAIGCIPLAREAYQSAITHARKHGDAYNENRYMEAFSGSIAYY